MKQADGQYGGLHYQDMIRDIGEMAAMDQPGRPRLSISRLRLSQRFENQQHVQSHGLKY